MSEWIPIKQEKPKDKYFWAFILGRFESSGFRDSQIRIIEQSSDLRSLDGTQVFVFEDDKEVFAYGLFSRIIAWLPISQFQLPPGYIFKDIYENRS